MRVRLGVEAGVSRGHGEPEAVGTPVTVTPSCLVESEPPPNSAAFLFRAS